MPSATSPNPLTSYEDQACEAVGRVIEFWGFKRNQGRLWALLYLRGRPHTAQEIIAALGLSKGAVSILTKELETWGVLRRHRKGSDGLLRYEAVSDLLHMVTQVIRRRESELISDVKEALTSARDDAIAQDAPVSVVERFDNMLLLANMASGAVHLLIDKVPKNIGDALKLFPRRFRRR